MQPAGKEERKQSVKVDGIIKQFKQSMAAFTTDEAAANLNAILNEWKLKWMIGKVQYQDVHEQESLSDDRVLGKLSIHTESE